MALAQRWIPLALLLTVTACGVKTKKTVYVDPDAYGAVEGTGIEARDVRAVVQEMSRELLSAGVVNSFEGVPRLALDPKDYSRISSNLVLTGTNRNCAGGHSPWGWLSCEENLAIGHGYVFLCDPEAEGLRDPDIKKTYGRFNHEAAAVHPETLVCYLTEDSGVSSFYRFVPIDPSTPFEGQLQALRIIGLSVFNTGLMMVGDKVNIDWVDIDEPDAGSGVRVEAQSKGAAIFVRGEGLWIHGDDIWICATSGGPVARGQIFRLRDGADESSLELVASSPDASVLDMPDNICVAPTGEVYMAEDGGNDQYIRFIDLDGEIRDFARNALSFSEFAGVCFSPAGDALFVNIQGDGLTLVITGPFGTGDGLEPGDGDGDGDGDSESAGDDGAESSVGQEGGASVGTASGDEVTSDDGRYPGDPMAASETYVGCACESAPGRGGLGLSAVLAGAAILCRPPLASASADEL